MEVGVSSPGSDWLYPSLVEGLIRRNTEICFQLCVVTAPSMQAALHSDPAIRPLSVLGL
jgi:hypothetical protein